MPRRLLLFGPPASGKGTHGARLAADLGIPHVATGDLLRDEVAGGGSLGKRLADLMTAGDLVPDDIVVDALVQRLRRPDADAGFILDGFPRTVAQADALDARLGPTGLDLVVALEVSVEAIVRRVTGRRICPRGHVYHVEFEPPATPGVCDVDGLALRQRDDDTEAAVVHRLEVYEEQSQPLLARYDERGLLRTVDATGLPEEVYPRVRSAVLA